MARSIPTHRFDELIRAATEEFIARGYRRTQMSDVAEAIGVAKGTVYGYVESKEALLLLCLGLADESDRIPVPDSLPIAAPKPGLIGKIVEERIAEAGQQPLLMRAIEQDRAVDIANELRDLLGEFFDLLSANRHRIKLLDRCMDHPDLGNLWQVAGRQHSRDLFIRYLEKRTASRQLRVPSDLRLAARFIIEVCTTWAVHIHWDPAPEIFAPVETRAEVIELLVHSLRPESTGA